MAQMTEAPTPIATAPHAPVCPLPEPAPVATEPRETLSPPRLFDPDDETQARVAQRIAACLASLVIAVVQEQGLS